MSAEKDNELLACYEAKHENYEKLKTIIWGMIRNVLHENGIEYFTIQSRLKNFKSFFEKCSRKNYSDPFLECTDIVAFRIIVFLERDIEKARNSVASLFTIDENNSVNKLRPDRIDSVGYKSLHLICSLGDTRENLPEYREITGLKFEVQI